MACRMPAQGRQPPRQELVISTYSSSACWLQANHPEITPPQWLQLSTLFPALDPTWHLDVFDRAFKVRLAEFKHLQRRPLPRPADMRGGILACEMGLGKTVELLACILAHPFPGPRVQPELVGLSLAFWCLGYCACQLSACRWARTADLMGCMLIQ